MLTWGALLVAIVAALLALGAAGTTDASDVDPVLFSFVTPDAGTLEIVERVVLFVATALVAGVGLLRSLVGLHPAGTRAPSLGRGAAVVAGIAAVAGGLIGDTTWPWALAHAALVAAVAVLLGRGRAVGPVAVVLAAVLAAEVAAGRHGLALPLELVATVALTVALGVAAVGDSGVAPQTPGDSGVAPQAPSVRESTSITPGRLDRAVRRRIAVTGLGACAVAAVAAAVSALVSGPWTVHDLFGSTSGVVTVARVALPLAALAVLVPALRGTGTPEQVRRELSRWASIALGATLVAAALLGALPTAPAAPAPGRALLRPVQLGLQGMALLVAPSPGGPTLMRLSPAAAGSADAGAAAAHADHSKPATPPDGYSVRVGAAPSVRFTPRAGAPGAWALVDLPPGTGDVTVTGPGGTATVPVTTGPAIPQAAVLAGPDGPECADAQLGSLVGSGGAVACPSASLDPADARALALTVADLGQRGLRSIYPVADDSPRSRAALDVVRAAAGRAGIVVTTSEHPDDGLLVLSGWDRAATTLSDVTARAVSAPTFTGGQFLAPWLLTPQVLAAGSSTMFPLSFVPQEATPRGYAAMLTRVFADAAPTSSGYLAWARARGLPPGDVRLYGASAMDVMPGMPFMNHGDHAGDWLPGGSVIPISGPLPSQKDQP